MAKHTPYEMAQIGTMLSPSIPTSFHATKTMIVLSPTETTEAGEEGQTPISKQLQEFLNQNDCISLANWLFEENITYDKLQFYNYHLLE